MLVVRHFILTINNSFYSTLCTYNVAILYLPIKKKIVFSFIFYSTLTTTTVTSWSDFNSIGAWNVTLWGFDLFNNLSLKKGIQIALINSNMPFISISILTRFVTLIDVFCLEFLMVTTSTCDLQSIMSLFDDHMAWLYRIRFSSRLFSWSIRLLLIERRSADTEDVRQFPRNFHEDRRNRENVFLIICPGCKGIKLES